MSGVALSSFVEDEYTPQTLPTSEKVVRYWDSYRCRTAIKLKPGEFAIGAAEEVLVTVIGTSVAVCLRDKSSSLAGMVHFMIPISGLSFLDQSTRFLAEEYGHFAFTRLIGAMEERGASRENLEASLIGGARLWRSSAPCADASVRFVRGYLAKKKIPVGVEFHGPRLPKKVYFTHSDRFPEVEVLEHYNNTIKNREQKYLRCVRADWMLQNQ
tara:strand:- start:39 stop:677 length:639 start_codon:yes stop_codon:yes gene_type:complete